MVCIPLKEPPALQAYKGSSVFFVPFAAHFAPFGANGPKCFGLRTLGGRLLFIFNKFENISPVLHMSTIGQHITSGRSRHGGNPLRRILRSIRP